MKAVRIALRILAVMAGLFIVWKGLCLWDEMQYRHKGDPVVHLVEEFRRKNHRLPSEDEVPKPGTESERGPYYHLVDSVNYIIYFAEGFDDDYEYDSKIKQWRYGP